MYVIQKDGVLVGYSDTAVFIRLHENGCYVPCAKAEAEGFCVKIAQTRVDEETGEETVELRDTVYALREGSLRGTEPVASLEEISGAMLLARAGSLMADTKEESE